jgi:hypothetical protein
LVEVQQARLKRQRLNTFSKGVERVQSNRFLHFNPSLRPATVTRKQEKESEDNLPSVGTLPNQNAFECCIGTSTAIQPDVVR